MVKIRSSRLKIISDLIKNIAGTTAVFYLILAGALYVWADRDRAWNHVVTCALSRYMPAYDFLTDFNSDRKKFDKQKMMEFERYFRKVAQFMPELPEAHAMLGFCCFYDGEIGSAKKSYEQAIKVYAKVFNFHYNLGIISLKQQDPRKALEHFKDSVKVDPIVNIQYVVNSRMYKPFFPFAHQPQALAAAMGASTYKDYRQAYLHILALCEKEKDFTGMLEYSRRAVSGGYLEKGLAYYYAGRASYGLKQYQDSAMYLQLALKSGFEFADVFLMMGHCLEELRRPESVNAMMAVTRLTKQGMVYNPEELNLDLLIY